MSETNDQRIYDRCIIRVGQLEAENEKLRELLRDTLPVMENDCAMCAYSDECTILADCKCIAPKRLRDRMRELGVS